MKKNNGMNGDYLKSLSSIMSSNLDVDEMENLLVGIFQYGIDLSKAYCEAVRKSNEEDENIKNVNDNIWRYEKGYVDFLHYKAMVNDSEVELGYIRTNILRLLVKYKGRPVNRDMILDQIWGYDVPADYRVIDVHISILRKKLALDDDIVSVRNIGYKLK